MISSGPNQTLAPIAYAMLAAGLCVLPAMRRGDEKRVALRSWKQYQERLPTEAEIESWFDSRPPANALCIVCGAVSGHLEMIDFDCWEGGGRDAFNAWRAAVEDACPGLADRLAIETTPAGGRHVVYRCESPIEKNLKLASRKFDADDDQPVIVGAKGYHPKQDHRGEWSVTVTLIETRGEGGLFLCDPSPGYSIVQGDLCSPPILTADERDVLISSARALGDSAPPVVDAPRKSADFRGNPSLAIRPGDDFNSRGDVRPIIRKHGWTLIRAGENEHWARPGKSAGTSATLKGGVLYVFSTNAPPFEPGHGYSPFAVYAMLEHGGDYTAAASALATDGYGSSQLAAGVDLSEFLKNMGATIARQPPADQIGPGPIPVGQLIAMHPRLREPVIHGLLREGETLNVIAAPKTGKSWLTLDLAIAVATGGAWLGRYETEAGPVLLVDNELHRETSAHRLPKVAHARGVDMADIADRIYVDNLRGRLHDINRLATYFEQFRPGMFKVVILDAFYRFMPAGGDENDNGTMANIYNRIDSFADRMKCCFVLIHHSTKGNQSGKSVTDVGAGAGSQSRATDSHLVLRPHEEDGVVVLDAAVRSWAPIEPVCLRWRFPTWDFDPDLDPESLRSDRKGGTRAAPRPAKAGKPAEAAWTVERFVERFVRDEPATAKKIIEAAQREERVSLRQAKEFIALATKRGLIEKCRLAGQGGPIGIQLPGLGIGGTEEIAP